MDGLISIAEYAKQRNVSQQSVYKRLNTTLKPYVREIDGKKWLDPSVFELGGSTVEQHKVVKSTNVDKPVEQPESGITKDLVRLLEDQLKAKDAEIERLHRDVEQAREAAAEAEAHNREQSKQLALLLAQSQELQRNNQLLLAEKNRQQEPATDPAADPEHLEVVQDTPKEKKKGFWARFLGR